LRKSNGNCIFCKIAKEKYQKDLPIEMMMSCFPDIHPVRPVHLLIIPKQPLLRAYNRYRPNTFQKLFIVVKNGQRQGLEKKGYRVTINGGGAQLVQHLHIHLTGSS